MQFLLIAHDGTDEGALDRRMAARDRHLEHIKPLVAAGNIVVGGAMLDDAGRMVGSYVVCDFPDRAALDAWIAGDPYTTGDVWRKIEVTPIRIAVKS
ncbi:MAG: hypothetical protein OHK0024_14310 [Thalassobaculales bacterium]